ncbi:MAG: epoxide hydrolase, soluble (sEH) [Cirrosporium novae-zelandiae]|nr:MAG: epoxide hydrolase, soluble (sEH) [Cirrosporium novae-zelandiae]
MDTIRPFDHGHADLVQACHKSYDGRRLVTASSDHRLKVFDRKKDGTDQLVDSWTAHDAEIIDVKWNSPLTTPLLASISEDTNLRIWLEDPTMPPLSGRRFRPVFSQTAPHKTPYASLDLLTTPHDLTTYLAVINKSGFLSVLEPVVPDDPSAWQPIDEFRVCNSPPRGEETGFLVRFHQDVKYGPSSLVRPSNVVSGSSSRAQTTGGGGVALAVGAMDAVKIYVMPVGARQFSLIVQLDLPGRGSLVRDIAWAGGAASGRDIIACASQEGIVRLREIQANEDASSTTERKSGEYQKAPSKSNGATQTSKPTPTPSGIGAGLAVTSRTRSPLRAGGDSRPRYQILETATLRHPQVRKVCFSPTGGALATAGDDGGLRIWRPSITGEWLEFWEASADEEGVIGGDEIKA